MMTATYSPDDNKLRLYSVARLDEETYQRVRGAGFKWAPKQELWVAPAWTPGREDLLIELCGEIDDEDTSLCDRAEQRAERFEEYSEKRERDANAAHAAVESIASNIPLGQPILVGHHSEKRARRDAEKIQNGMRRAVKLWETSQYWTRRARGAVAHAKYKERPDVRHRRIKRLEADERKQRKARDTSEQGVHAWEKVTTAEQAKTLANYDRAVGYDIWSQLKREEITHEQAREQAIRTHRGIVARADRWLAHLGNRLAYERAMLGAAGGIEADRHDLAVGGRVLVRREWCTITRLNKKGGQLVSVSTNRRFCRVVAVEEIQEYQAPTEDQAAAVAAATKKAPLCNYPGEGFVEITKDEWKRTNRDYKGTYSVPENGTTGAHRIRRAMYVGGKGCTLSPVYITDQARKDPPKKAPPPELIETEPDEAPAVEEPAPDLPGLLFDARQREARRNAEPPPNKFDAMRESLRAGVVTVSAPSLFVTPDELADRVIREAAPRHLDRILEPSAGTGSLVRAALRRDSCARVVALEVNVGVAATLQNIERGTNVKVFCRDFMETTPDDLGELGQFDRVVMNPPFERGQDAAHVRHAFDFLVPGGRLVAIMSPGPFFRSDRKSVAFREWFEEQGGVKEELPEGSFSEAGTNVRTVLVTIDKEG